MKIGYPGINLGIGCKCSHTFRLAVLSDEKLIETATKNIRCLERILKWNVTQGLYFFRISSNLIPFASHPVMQTEWKNYFKSDLQRIGKFIRDNDIRISMHPGQFVVINSPSINVYENSVSELIYHAELLDLMGLDSTHKFQIHIGGMHGDPENSMIIFVERYNQLPQIVKDRLVIENDERSASLQDCLRLNTDCGIPVLFDTLHHQIKNNGETVLKGLDLAMGTWKENDGVPMIDYSSQDTNKRLGAHTETLDVERFRAFIKNLRGRDIDIMLEIKNKEASVLQARLVIDNLEPTTA